MAGCGGGATVLCERTPFCCGRWAGARMGGLISIGGTLSTAGKGAQGDFAGVGAAGFETSVGFSEGVFRTKGLPGFG